MDLPPNSLPVSNVEEALHILTFLQANDQLANAISILATASRTDPHLRIRLSDPRKLSKLVKTIEYGLKDELELTRNALRCIGNACIDNNLARREVCKLGLTWVQRCFAEGEGEIQALAVKVLYNLCHDYEPAQSQCYREHVHHDLITLCACVPSAESESRSMIIELMFATICHGPELSQEVKEDDVLPDDVLRKLLTLPDHWLTIVGVEEFASLIESCLTFLRDPRVQTRIIDLHIVGDVWRILECITTTIHVLESSLNDTLEQVKLLEPMSQSLIWSLSDLAANPRFEQKYSFNDPLLYSLLRLIEACRRKHVVVGSLIATEQSEVSGRHAQTLAAACQVIGNFLFNSSIEDRGSIAKTRPTVHQSLWEILGSDQYTWRDLLHSAAGVLLQLSRGPPEIRAVLGDDTKAMVALKRLCGHETPELRRDGVRLLKALGKDCPGNQERFAELANSILVSPVNGDGDEPVVVDEPS